MGIQLATALSTHGTGLGAPAFKVALRMALSALDVRNAKGQEPHLYFGGWEPLAVALGHSLDQHGRMSPAGKQAVKRAVGELRSAGLVEPLQAPTRTGTRQTYRLTFGLSDRSPSRKPDPQWGTESDPQWGTESDPQWGTESDPQWGTDSVPPRREVGESRTTELGISVTSQPQPTTRARDVAEKRHTDAAGETPDHKAAADLLGHRWPQVERRTLLLAVRHVEHTQWPHSDLATYVRAFTYDDVLDHYSRAKECGRCRT